MKPWILTTLLFAGCTPCCDLFAFSDTDVAAVAARCENKPQNVKCYASDGKVILEAQTNGVAHYQGGAVVFIDMATQKVMRVQGTCTVIDVGR